MKTVLLYLALLISFSCFAKSGTTSSPATALEYNDKIVTVQNKVGICIQELLAVVDDSTSTYEQAEVVRKQGTDSVRNYIRILQNMPAWKGDTAFRNCSIRLFTFNEEAFDRYYATMIRLLYKGNLTGEENEELNAAFENLKTKEKIFDNAFGAEQDNFAAKNNFTLTED